MRDLIELICVRYLVSLMYCSNYTGVLLYMIRSIWIICSSIVHILLIVFVKSSLDEHIMTFTYSQCAKLEYFYMNNFELRF